MRGGEPEPGRRRPDLDGGLGSEVPGRGRRPARSVAGGFRGETGGHGAVGPGAGGFRDGPGAGGPPRGGPATGGFRHETGNHRGIGPIGGPRDGAGRPPGGPAGPPGPVDPDDHIFIETSEVPALDRPAPSTPFPGADEPADWGDDDPFDDAYGDDSYDYVDYDDDLDGALEGDLDDLPRRRGCRSAVVVLAVMTVMVLVAGWFAWSWVQGKIDPAGPPGDEVLVEIPAGTSTTGIGDVLAEAGVISDASVWGWYTKLRDVPTIQAGSYRLHLNSSFDEAIDELAQDPLPPNSRLVTAPEGLTMTQVRDRLADPEKGVPGFTPERVQAAMEDPESRSAFLPGEQASIEGTLYPETYAVEEGDTEAVVVQRMVAMFDEVMTELNANERAAALNISPYEAVIVASMVERESGTDADRPRVARVIYNRLAAGEPLGIDATSCYEKGGIPCELTTAELTDNTAYDTREQPGLPPTPIASPGRASLEAALAPAEGDWHWYVLDVTKDDGSSLFFTDYDEFLAAKQRCVDAGQCG